MPPPAPRIVDLHRATGAVGEMLRERSTCGIPVVAIAGPTASGKSTLAADIAATLAADALVLSTDRYLPDYGGLAPEDVDQPRHARLDRLGEDLGELRAGRATDVPVWSFHTHAPAGEERVGPAPVIVVEGLFALHDTLTPRTDLRVLLEIPEAVRRDRVVARERSAARGWGLDRVRHHFDHVANPTFAEHEPAYRANAHLIVTDA
ncbi:MAG: hypothetical protein AAF108_00580 [Planctomycetota bacterium]